jgi:hypothetical protein
MKSSSRNHHAHHANGKNSAASNTLFDFNGMPLYRIYTQWRSGEPR